MYRAILFGGLCTAGALSQVVSGQVAAAGEQVSPGHSAAGGAGAGEAGIVEAVPAVPQLRTVQMLDAIPAGPVGITTALAGPMVNVAGAPYSAQVTTERIQVLADGNRIVQTTSGSVARDGKGRVRRDEGLAGLKTDSGEAPHIVMIDDPVAHVHWTLDAQSKTAMKLPQPEVRAGGPAAGAGQAGTRPVLNQMILTRPEPPGGEPLGPPNVAFQTIIRDGPGTDANTTKTDLGVQTMEGVPAHGTRVTREIPAGTFGNEQPMLITTETWYSPDLKVLVMSKSSDPRMGDTTYKLTNIQRSEPAASLFQIPDDYKVRDAPGTFLFHTEKN